MSKPLKRFSQSAIESVKPDLIALKKRKNPPPNRVQPQPLRIAEETQTIASTIAQELGLHPRLDRRIVIEEIVLRVWNDVQLREKIVKDLKDDTNIRRIAERTGRPRR